MTHSDAINPVFWSNHLEINDFSLQKKLTNTVAATQKSTSFKTDKKSTFA